MQVFFWVLIVGLGGILCLLVAMPLYRYRMSDFAGKRFAAEFGKNSEHIRWLLRFRDQVAVLRMVLVFLTTLLLIIIATQLYVAWGGVLIATLFLLVAACCSKISFMQDIVEKLLFKRVSYVQQVVRITSPVLHFFTTPFQITASRPTSYDEFLDTLRRLPSTVLAPQQKQRIESVLSAEEKKVKDIMTLKNRVIAAEPSATLGPVVLSDLEKSGHQYFPVMTKKGEPQGILNLKDLDNIHDAKQRTHVRDIMKEYIVWVEEGDSLFALTQRLLKEKQHIMLVRNEEGEYCGLVTTADIVKHLTSITEDEDLHP